MAEPLQAELEQLLAAREQARAAFTQAVQTAVAADLQALDAYRDARAAALAQPENDTLWAAVNQARTATQTASSATTTALTQAAQARDAAILQAARAFAAKVPAA